MIKKYEVSEIDCAVCAGKIENAIKNLDGVKSAQLNFITGTLTVEAEDRDFSRLEKEIVKAGRKTERDFEIEEL
ncbi:MAG: heavy-metal-associated domain-containing protein [Ruminococcaceae bacterium]|nr:heavy-metal-associated domain-containing protein [Oscillospiraceae bacterium]